MERSHELTSFAPDIHQLLELEAGTREAWSAYNERLRDLSGDEYELAESDSWTELQSELRRIEHQRESLGVPAA
jgi:hypothetical protein